MKSIFSLLVAAAAVVAHTLPDLEARDDCGHSITPIYRMYNSKTFDHFYTTNAVETITAYANDEYLLEGVAAGAFPTQQGNTLPLYRLYNSGKHDHFYTTNPVERDFFTTNNGYKWEGTLALVYTTQICGSVPLYRLFAASVTDHFYTTSEAERANALNLGFTDEGVVAYVPAKGVVTGMPV
ncbi:hypothetical protein R3P38DRAFT_2618524 [Favolaschia claudopus]|uniref:DUF5648 domain-containing protein n=1 Tax=Favolaschia claudopus TaxID=2862362 RepID=A0AAW0BYZ2_9AGAR